MKAYYLLVSLLGSLKVIATPLGGSDADIYGALHSKVKVPVPAPDPPPAPAPLIPSQDGVSPDNSVINYTPNNPSNQQHSCWTPFLSRPDPSQPYAKGTCSLCVMQRNRNDGSSDYLLWARDNLNNCMGNMPPTIIWPLDNQGTTHGLIQNNITMGGSQLQLTAMRSSEDPQYTQVFLDWATAPQRMFDPAPTTNSGDNCVSAGGAANGVVYFICFFPC